MDSEERVLDEFRLGPSPRLDVAAGFDVAIYCGTISFLAPWLCPTHPRECENQRRSSLLELAMIFNSYSKTHRSY